MGEFVSFSHSTGNNVHHIEWCTKYRYKMFRQFKYRIICRNAIDEVAKRHKIGIRSIGVQEDHVHVIADLPPTMSQSEATRLLKGGSSYLIFRMAPKFRYRYPRGALWSRGNFKDSVGRITVETAERYVQAQDDVGPQTSLAGYLNGTPCTQKSAGFSPQSTQQHF